MLSETLRKHSGSKVQALGCLTQLGNELSCPQLTIAVETINEVGLRLWTSSVEVSPDGEGPDVSLGMEGDTVTDGYWRDHVLDFPDAWPEKANVAVSISDPAAWPSKHRLLNNDPVVLSFWRCLGLAQQLLEKAKGTHKKCKDAASKDESPAAKERLAEAQGVLDSRTELIKKARALQRNVPLTFIYCPDEKYRQDEALSLREDIEFLRDMCGLSGWDRVCILGNTRDTLRTRLNRSVNYEELVEALKSVRWGAGREISIEVAKKWIPLYEKFINCAEVVAIVRKAQALVSQRHTNYTSLFRRPDFCKK